MARHLRSSILDCRFLALVCLLVLPALASAKTIVLTDGICDRMAAINARAPRMSWAAYEPTASFFYSSTVDIGTDGGFLFRFPLDQIPPGHRITKAELLIPVAYFYGTNRRMYVWRMTSEWGPGTCWQYRMITPEKKIEWGEAGARAAGTDRATRPTAVMAFPPEPGERIINVTQDVELWNTGAAKNQGWLITVEDPDSVLRFTCPIYQPDIVKLRITYEPQ